MATKVIILTSGSTWTVPSDFSPSNNTIEAIGGGGGSGSSWSAGGAGGGGGAYTKLSNFAVYPGQVVNINIGTGAATPTANGGDTWLNTLTASAPSSSTNGLLAKGGSFSSNTTGGSGGLASASIPSAAAFNGGNGGNGGVNGAGGGGGGAGGPSGAGANGGNPVGTAAGGGGGSNGGSGGSSPGAGGASGGSPAGSGGAAATSGAAAVAGGVGAGGGGGGGGLATTNYKGGAGGAGVYWTATSTTAQTTTISIANPAIFTVTTAPQTGTRVVFSTTGVLPAAITAGTTYYVINVSTTTFNVSATLNGTAISTVGNTQSGTHTATFTAVAGPGGGSGGGTSTAGPTTITGSGGNYGGGQGNQNGDTSGKAGSGIIVITYTTPTYATRLNSSGNFYTVGYFDEITGLTGVATRTYSNGTFLIANTGIFDEIASQNAYLGSITLSTSNSNYLQVASNTAFQLDNTGGITVEMWIYPTSSTVSQGFVGYNSINTGGSTNGGWMFAYSTVAGQVELATYENNSAAATTALTSNNVHLSINSWQHIAFTANSTYGNIWINGANVAYGAIGGTSYGAADLRIGSWNYSIPRFFNGNIADLRITSNTILYTNNFTPPTLKLTALANTQLLLSTPYGSPQANTFSDFSSFARTVTLNGTGAPVSNNYSPTLTNVPTLRTPPMRLYSNGAVQILGAFDEVTRPT